MSAPKSRQHVFRTEFHSSPAPGTSERSARLSSAPALGCVAESPIRWASLRSPGFRLRLKSVTQCRTLREVPPPGSYRLRRHFPRLCNFPTRVRHPYRARSLRDSRSNVLSIRPPPKAPHLQDPTLHPRKGAANPQLRIVYLQSFARGLRSLFARSPPLSQAPSTSWLS